MNWRPWRWLLGIGVLSLGLWLGWTPWAKWRIDRLLKQIKPGISQQQEKALARHLLSWGERGQDRFFAHLEKVGRTERVGLARLLAQMGRRAEPLVAMVMQHPNWWVREAAIVAVRRAKENPSWRLRWLLQGFQDPHASVKYEALQGLRELGALSRTVAKEVLSFLEQGQEPAPHQVLQQGATLQAGVLSKKGSGPSPRHPHSNHHHGDNGHAGHRHLHADQPLGSIRHALKRDLCLVNNDAERLVRLLVVQNLAYFSKTPKELADWLARALSDRERSVRFEAARQLVNLGRVAVAPLAKRLFLKAPQYRAQAAKLLGKLGGLAVPEVLRVLRSSRGAPWFAAMEALQAMGEKGKRAIHDICQVVVSATSTEAREGIRNLAALGEAGASCLRRLVRSRRPRDRWRALRVVGESVGRLSVRTAEWAIRVGLKDKEQTQKEVAFWAAARWGLKLRSLLPDLWNVARLFLQPQHKKHEVRPSTSSVGKLRPASQASNWAVAAKKRGSWPASRPDSLQHRAIRTVKVKVVDAGDPSHSQRDSLRIVMLRALVRVGKDDARIEPWLRSCRQLWRDNETVGLVWFSSVFALTNVPDWVWEESEQAAERFSRRGRILLFRHWKERPQSWIHRWAKVRRFGRHRSRDLRERWFRLLGEVPLPHPEKARELGLGLRDSDAWVREAAAWAIGEQTSPQTVWSLLLLRACQDSSWRVRRSIVRSLGRVPKVSSKVVPRLIQMLQEPKWQVRREIVRTLGLLRDRRAHRALQVMRRDPNFGVQLAVREALLRILQPNQRNTFKSRSTRDKQ